MKVSKVLLNAYYNLDGEYIAFPDNPMHGKTFENVKVEFKKETITVCGINYAVDVIYIEGQEPIECELIRYRKTKDNVLIVEFCQDWG